jgi:hypothetical protein
MKIRGLLLALSVTSASCSFMVDTDPYRGSDRQADGAAASGRSDAKSPGEGGTAAPDLRVPGQDEAGIGLDGDSAAPDAGSEDAQVRDARAPADAAAADGGPDARAG